MSILNKYKRWKNPFAVIRDKYWDFVLSLDKTPSISYGNRNTEECLSAYVDFSDRACYTDFGAVSKEDFTWENAVNSGYTLDDIGFTGMDNGLILFDKNRITDDGFLSLLTGSTLEIEPEDFRLKMIYVSGNTGAYSYDVCENDGFISLKGGFLQGFFKLDGFDYQVLPSVFDEPISFEFTLRPNNYVTKKNTLNSFYPENKGIFFYLGTRAENKFAKMYGANLDEYEDRDISAKTSCDNYFYDDYFVFGDELEKCVPLSGDTNIDGSTITDSEGNLLISDRFTEIETDNKFLFFDRTKDGYTVKTWDSGMTIVLQYKMPTTNTNLFLVMNRTKTGLTVNDIDKLESGVYTYDIETDSIIENQSGDTSGSGYNILNDILGNAFALKINDDMSVGYRYMVKDCDSKSGYKILEESTVPNMLKVNEWATIHVKLVPLNGMVDKCGNQSKNRKMKLYLYVNGYLKLVSQEMDMLYLRGLDDRYTMQEGVPYNISLGGGTQGLAESIWIKYREMFPKVLPLEKNFAGTFIGDIKTFKIYTCGLQYPQIRNNYLFEKITY